MRAAINTPRKTTTAAGCAAAMILALAGTAESGAGAVPMNANSRSLQPSDQQPSDFRPSDFEPPEDVAQALPGLQTTVAMSNLDIPWDVGLLPSGAWLVTERERLRITIRRPNGQRDILVDRPNHFWASGETGLMSIAVDPRVRRNDRFYTCTGYVADGTPEVRVIAWHMNKARTKVTRVEPLLTGIDISSGRHGGCRIRFDPRGAMYVGTGDSAVGTNPQNLGSLNGKVLRLNRFNGNPWPSNPWPRAADRDRRYVYTYGHRNVQGLAFRPGDRMWSVEHGTYRDDEVNRLVRGGNYGWNPVPGYNESVPMTDFSLPGRQRAARWNSGEPTIATSGATWVRGKQWGGYRGTLAVGALGGERLVFMKFDANHKLMWTRTPAELDGDFGRLRSVVQTKSGALLVTTANGGGNDKIVRVSPR
ncbi:MAG: PQQ-dependent sugar dehydrogenase [Nocardioidaceae bacterium]